MVRLIQVSIGFILLMVTASSALPVTNRDVLEMMSGKEAGVYLAATVDMAAFMAHVEGDRQRSRCIVDWYFDNEDTTAYVMKVLERFQDRTPQAVIYTLINRQCGEP